MAWSLPALLLLLCSLGVSQALLRVYNLRADGLNADPTTPADCYVKLFYDSKGMGMTSFKVDTNSPWWDDEFAYPGAEQGSILRVEAWDKDLIYDDKLGSCQFLLRLGTWIAKCHLAEGGTLYFNYTLS
ncbi:hypothetical protein GBF38_019783 [Nibea albiflora]|uniref:Uncharacterized protein n=1 Tax=Nibea albiflora TaxID=240163 RepID=A0ACB7F350_NIBAL|nr:hypothetical protein GBF38_019783 [Nibea albiflora]